MPKAIHKLFSRKSWIKFKHKSRKINVKNFMLRSVVRTIPTIWNTFSYLFRFAETTLAKSWRWKLISKILNNKNEELFYFFAIAISFKIKNASTVQTKLPIICVNVSGTYFQSYTIKQSNLPLHSHLQGGFSKIVALQCLKNSQKIVR